MEIYGPIRIAKNDAGSYPWLIRRPIRECVTWALVLPRALVSSAQPKVKHCIHSYNLNIMGYTV